MVTQDQIARINELARKKKAEGLTPEEAKEQQALREAYVKSVRQNFRSQLDSIRVVDEKGKVSSLKGRDVSELIPGLKPESEYTEDEKTHVAELSDKLAREFSQSGGEPSITELGNPRKPEGEAGKEMIRRMNESHSGLTDWALTFLRLEKGEKVLDIGCGGGAALAKMADKLKDGHLTGIDYSDVSVAESSEKNAAAIAEGRMDIIGGSVSDMPFEDGAYDEIISVESYFFWPDLASDMKEVFRVLAPGGKLLLIAEMYMKEGLSETQLENSRKYAMNNLTIDGFKELFAATGFEETLIHLKEGTSWIVVEGRKA